MMCRMETEELIFVIFQIKLIRFAESHYVNVQIKFSYEYKNIYPAEIVEGQLLLFRLPPFCKKRGAAKVSNKARARNSNRRRAKARRVCCNSSLPPPLLF